MPVTPPAEAGGKEQAAVQVTEPPEPQAERVAAELEMRLKPGHPARAM
jgi:hypothetical protein